MFRLVSTAALHKCGESFAVEMEIHQREAGALPVVVLADPR
jgi:hypothetical protein